MQKQHNVVAGVDMGARIRRAHHRTSRGTWRPLQGNGAYQTEEGEAKRDDENFFYVGCWEYQGNDTTAPVLNKEPLEYEAIKVQTRNYKN